MILQLTDLSSEPLCSQIARQIRDRVLSGELPPDLSLPAARSLARSLRTSSDTVARAYEILATEGLVRVDDETARVVESPPDRPDGRDRPEASAAPAQGQWALEELTLAREIQCRLLPPSLVAGRGWRVASRNEAARFVAGDFYDVIRHQDGRVDLVIADVAGKGAAAGLIMASVKAVMPFLAATRNPAEILTALNRRLRRDLSRREFVAMCVVRFDPSTRLIEWANAGVPDPWVLDDGGGGRALVAEGDRLPLGIRTDLRYRRTHDVLGEGEQLLLTTDGLAEHPVGEGCFGYANLAATAVSLSPSLAPEAWLEALFREVRRAGGSGGRDDDWTALLLRAGEGDLE